MRVRENELAISLKLLCNFVEFSGRLTQYGDREFRGIRDVCQDDRIIHEIKLDAEFALEMDPSLRSDADLIYKKGMLALTAYRVAKRLLHQGEAELAFSLHATCANYLSVDIDPRCTIEPGIYLDHATGIVIGETAYIGSRVLLYHGVTLGSLRPQPRGAVRHPRLDGNNIIGCGATLLGPLRVHSGANVRTGSLVTGDVYSPSEIKIQYA